MKVSASTLLLRSAQYAATSLIVGGLKFVFLGGSSFIFSSFSESEGEDEDEDEDAIEDEEFAFRSCSVDASVRVPFTLPSHSVRIPFVLSFFFPLLTLRLTIPDFFPASDADLRYSCRSDHILNIVLCVIAPSTSGCGTKYSFNNCSPPFAHCSSVNCVTNLRNPTSTFSAN